MGRADELRAELAAAEFEERLVALKADPKADPEELRRTKHELREARRVFRQAREAAPPEEAAGDAVARPAAIKAKSSVKRPGGDG
jgi:hypothetical protein